MKVEGLEKIVGYQIISLSIETYSHQGFTSQQQ